MATSHPKSQKFCLFEIVTWQGRISEGWHSSGNYYIKTNILRSPLADAIEIVYRKGRLGPHKTLSNTLLPYWSLAVIDSATLDGTIDGKRLSPIFFSSFYLAIVLPYIFLHLMHVTILTVYFPLYEEFFDCSFSSPSLDYFCGLSFPYNPWPKVPGSLSLPKNSSTLLFLYVCHMHPSLV